MKTLRLVLEERRGDTVYRVERQLRLETVQLFSGARDSILLTELADMEKALEQDVEITNKLKL